MCKVKKKNDLFMKIISAITFTWWQATPTFFLSVSSRRRRFWIIFHLFGIFSRFSNESFLPFSAKSSRAKEEFTAPKSIHHLLSSLLRLVEKLLLLHCSNNSTRTKLNANKMRKIIFFFFFFARVTEGLSSFLLKQHSPSKTAAVLRNFYYNAN